MILLILLQATIWFYLKQTTKVCLLTFCLIYCIFDDIPIVTEEYIKREKDEL